GQGSGNASDLRIRGAERQRGALMFVTPPTRVPNSPNRNASSRSSAECFGTGGTRAGEHALRLRLRVAGCGAPPPRWLARKRALPADDAAERNAGRRGLQHLLSWPRRTDIARIDAIDNRRDELGARCRTTVPQSSFQRAETVAHSPLPFARRRF